MTSAPKSARVLAAKGAGDQLAEFDDFEAGEGGGVGGRREGAADMPGVSGGATDRSMRN